eukprot:GDKH01005937.1.p2 GENE.GDKH01005937.1~~GDKH01005937.1.p2  ORF type:complete len:127 (+),score=10.33 GDKH01005937.1:180-560(+)
MLHGWSNRLDGLIPRDSERLTMVNREGAPGGTLHLEGVFLCVVWCPTPPPACCNQGTRRSTSTPWPPHGWSVKKTIGNSTVVARSFTMQLFCPAQGGSFFAAWRRRDQQRSRNNAAVGGNPGLAWL